MILKHIVLDIRFIFTRTCNTPSLCGVLAQSQHRYAISGEASHDDVPQGPYVRRELLLKELILSISF